MLCSWIGGELTTFHLRTVSNASMAALAYLIVFGSIVTFTAYAWLMQVAPAWRVATHAYVNPVVAVALGSAVAGEPLTAALVVSTVVIAGGVAMILLDQMPSAAERRRSVWTPIAQRPAEVQR